MENTIDRKIYRRTQYEKEIKNKGSNTKKHIFLNQIINALLILLFVLLLKFFEFEYSYNKIKEIFFSGIQCEELEKYMEDKNYQIFIKKF